MKKIEVKNLIVVMIIEIVIIDLKIVAVITIVEIQKDPV